MRSNEASDTPRVAMQVSRDAVVASIQIDLHDDVLVRFRQDLLDRIHETGVRAVILDVSGLDILDAEEFAALRRIMVMASLMGAESVLVGLQPGVASALIEAGADVDGLSAASNLDDAFSLLAFSIPRPDPELEAEPESEPGPESEAEDEPESEPDPDLPRGVER